MHEEKDRHNQKDKADHNLMRKRRLGMRKNVCRREPGRVYITIPMITM
jgi:hypothetical protein